MTRFARASGSKASNQRLPDEATPWSELKQKVTNVKSPTTETNENKSDTNWKKVIHEEKKVEENVNSVWCDFPESGEINNKNISSKSGGKKRSYDIGESNYNDQVNIKKQRKHPKKKNLNATTTDDALPPTGARSQEDGQEVPQISPALKESGTKYKGSKNWSVTGREFKKSSFQSQPHNRRKLDEGDQTLDVNGQSFIVTRFDGFYILKDDAKRIKVLEKELIAKGVSKEEVRAVVKKERRIAEKYLARQKKKVCFHCRKGGHNLSSCPKLSSGGSEAMGSGICYKCGSTEHSHLQCRVSTGYKFAVCFVCKEEGHIARECPDNPRGLYPQGGSCMVCGDVTHLRKDCPQAPTKEKVTLDLMGDNIEALTDMDIERVDPPKEANIKKKNKIIKFK